MKKFTLADEVYLQGLLSLHRHDPRIDDIPVGYHEFVNEAYFNPQITDSHFNAYMWSLLLAVESIGELR